jgi:hypothetical protein
MFCAKCTFIRDTRPAPFLQRRNSPDQDGLAQWAPPRRASKSRQQLGPLHRALRWFIPLAAPELAARALRAAIGVLPSDAQLAIAGPPNPIRRKGGRPKSSPGEQSPASANWADLRPKLHQIVRVADMDKRAKIAQALNISQPTLRNICSKHHPGAGLIKRVGQWLSEGEAQARPASDHRPKSRGRMGRMVPVLP